ncbi:MAG: Maf family protein [Heliobacteriaceae bacterium]|jgi:septum formation protein|nr:Maf family protein [Heliobacteriaceae bacterium]
MGKIILASSSPRRSDIMKKSGYKFRVIPSPYKEDNTAADFSYEFIENLAYLKAKAAAEIINEPALVIGADTLVVLEGRILCKPENEAGACEMLRKLSGKTHAVITAIAVIDNGSVRKNSTTSHVTFENLTEEQIQSYVKKYKPLDKAGAYGIQEMPEGYIKSYEGSLENIIGLCPKALAKVIKRYRGPAF